MKYNNSIPLAPSMEEKLNPKNKLIQIPTSPSDPIDLPHKFPTSLMIRGIHMGEMSEDSSTLQ
jgi:hypothetical protein